MSFEQFRHFEAAAKGYGLVVRNTSYKNELYQRFIPSEDETLIRIFLKEIGIKFDYYADVLDKEELDKCISTLRRRFEQNPLKMCFVFLLGFTQGDETYMLDELPLSVWNNVVYPLVRVDVQCMQSVSKVFFVDGYNMEAFLQTAQDKMNSEPVKVSNTLICYSNPILSGNGWDPYKGTWILYSLSTFVQKYPSSHLEELLDEVRKSEVLESGQFDVDAATSYVTFNFERLYFLETITASATHPKILLHKQQRPFHARYKIGFKGEGLPQRNTYSDILEMFLRHNIQYLHDLQLLSKVFKENLTSKLKDAICLLEEVFQCIMDIENVTATIMFHIEDVRNTKEPNKSLAVGKLFLDLAENAGFEVYYRYAEVYDNACRIKLEDLLSRIDVEKMKSTGVEQSFVDALKYYFPKLLLEPFYYCEKYLEFIKALHGVSPSKKDKCDLIQAYRILTPLRAVRLDLQIPRREISSIIDQKKKQIAQQKVIELKTTVLGFEDCFRHCSGLEEFLYEGELTKISLTRKSSDRYVFLFDGCIVLCKPNVKEGSISEPVSSDHQQYSKYRLKLALPLKDAQVHDKKDTEEAKHLFEILPQYQPPILLSCKTGEEKRSWMEYLVMLTTKNQLERLLDQSIANETKKQPIHLFLSDKYRFATPDSDLNIVFNSDNGNCLAIQGATVLKLVERLTDPNYSEVKFVNIFLTTYRSFCTPHEFLDLLFERFKIPEPKLPHPDDIQSQQILSRFKTEYSRPVQFRVLAVLKQWLMYHLYDFQNDPTLQERLEQFLDIGQSKGISRIFEYVRRHLKRSVPTSTVDLQHYIADVDIKLPNIKYYIQCPQPELNILTLIPTEFAWQLSLLDFDYYRAVKASELVGSILTTDKEQHCPNVTKIIKHTTKVTRWFKKAIIDAENVDERVAIVSRILETMIVMRELNNFNGVLAVVAVMESAAVHRLYYTFQRIEQRLLDGLEHAQKLQNEDYKEYEERLKTINPPCVPYLGTCLTNILRIEEGNSDFIPNSTDLINFTKKRRLFETAKEFTQFQYYQYDVNMSLREFIKNLQPFPAEMSESEVAIYLYEKSLIIEPSSVMKLPEFPRKWPELDLTSGFSEIGIESINPQQTSELQSEPFSAQNPGSYSVGSAESFSAILKTAQEFTTIILDPQTELKGDFCFSKDNITIEGNHSVIFGENRGFSMDYCNNCFIKNLTICTVKGVGVSGNFNELKNIKIKGPSGGERNLQTKSDGLIVSGFGNTLNSLEITNIHKSGLWVFGDCSVMNNLKFHSVYDTALSIKGNNHCLEDISMTECGNGLYIRGDNNTCLKFCYNSPVPKTEVPNRTIICIPAGAGNKLSQGVISGTSPMTAFESTSSVQFTDCVFTNTV